MEPHQPHLQNRTEVPPKIQICREGTDQSTYLPVYRPSPHICLYIDKVPTQTLGTPYLPKYLYLSCPSVARLCAAHLKTKETRQTELTKRIGSEEKDLYRLQMAAAIKSKRNRPAEMS